MIWSLHQHTILTRMHDSALLTHPTGMPSSNQIPRLNDLQGEWVSDQIAPHGDHSCQPVMPAYQQKCLNVS
jgi:hypothetical protein